MIPDAIGRWKLEDNVLTVALPDGRVNTPPAELIYQAAVEKRDVGEIPSIGDDAVTCALSFSRRPLHPRISIEEAPFHCAAQLIVRIRAAATNEDVELPSVPGAPPEHVVVGRTWYPLVRGAMEELSSVLADAGIEKQGPINLRQFLDLRKLAISSGVIDDRSGTAASASAQAAPANFRVAASFTGELFSYQRDGLRWLSTLCNEDLGGILADEMGLGKTIQIVALFAAEIEAGGTPMLVVAPGTLLENWRREIAKFSTGIDVTIHRGQSRTGFPSELNCRDVVITSYDTLVRDLSLLKSVQWNLVVLDEAQAIKNPETLRSDCVKQLPRRVGIAVTGTPVENRLRDLWSLTDFTIPGFLGQAAAFESEYGDDEFGATALEPLVSPIMLRRRVSEVADDLPDRIDVPQVLELGSAESEAYDKIRQAAVMEYGPSATFVALMQLRQYCAHPDLLESRTGDPTRRSPKYVRLTEILAELFENSEKAIVFTSFQKMTDILVTDISSRFGVHVAFIDGRVPIHDRQAVVDDFSAFDGPAVLVLNPRAAGTGLNITAANHVIHYNLEWNPAVEDQASARAHRRGQEKVVTVHRLFYAGTVEEVIDDRLTRKRGLADSAVVGTDGKATDSEDILQALRKSPIAGDGA